MKKIETERPQVNVRLTDELIRLLDAKRVELLVRTRSDVVRIAIDIL